MSKFTIELADSGYGVKNQQVITADKWILNPVSKMFEFFGGGNILYAIQYSQVAAIARAQDEEADELAHEIHVDGISNMEIRLRGMSLTPREAEFLTAAVASRVKA